MQGCGKQAPAVGATESCGSFAPFPPEEPSGIHLRRGAISASGYPERRQQHSPFADDTRPNSRRHSHCGAANTAIASSENAGHWIMEEQPEAAVAVISQFLNAKPRRGLHEIAQLDRCFPARRGCVGNWLALVGRTVFRDGHGDSQFVIGRAKKGAVATSPRRDKFRSD